MNLGSFEIGLNVQDIARSLAFYQTLGFELVDGGVDIRTVTLRRGDCRSALYQGYGEDPLYLQFRHGDVEAIARDLTRKRLRFERHTKDDRGAAAPFEGPCQR
jgi:catechol 2,3-dioxygenase-like lactoylglutathione lyase family enzyme